MTKLKTITLSYPHLNRFDGTGYRVEQITDSTEFTPRQLLTKAEVDELCGAKDWKVTVKPSAVA